MPAGPRIARRRSGGRCATAARDWAFPEGLASLVS